MRKENIKTSVHVGGSFLDLDSFRKGFKDIFIVNRDSPDYLGGAMVSLFIQRNLDSYDNPAFGLLPFLLPIHSVSYTYDDDVRHVHFAEWGNDDTFALMGEAVCLALNIASYYSDRDHNIYVINESGTTESTICSVYSYIAERGFTL